MEEDGIRQGKMENLLTVQNMSIEIKTQKGIVHAVRHVDLELRPHETLALVGESGCGKSMTMKGVMRILPENGTITEGAVLFQEQDLTRLSEREMQKIRGSEIAMIFQDPMTSLNPTMKVGKQIEEMLKKHRRDMGRAARKERAIELLGLVGIANADTRYHQYPHQLSGGMRQRIVIAIALACEPKLLIADEPTTALDVTIQAQILDLMRELQKKIETSIIIITHNLGVVANVADRVAVMYGGKIVETAPVRELFSAPSHEYTRALLRSIPKLGWKEKLHSIPGTPPDLMNPPEGCPFAPRCTETMEVCREYAPGNFRVTEEHQARCWMLDERAGGRA